MHKSQLAGFIIDCNTDDLDAAADFWGTALGKAAVRDPRSDNTIYRRLETRSDELDIEVQKVQHESRVHLDIETDDVQAEVARLEALGARDVGGSLGTRIATETCGSVRIRDQRIHSSRERRGISGGDQKAVHALF